MKKKKKALTVQDFRLATKEDIGKGCYYSDIPLEEFVEDFQLHSDEYDYEILDGVYKDDFIISCEGSLTIWKYAFVKKEPWTPKEGETYYFISGNGYWLTEQHTDDCSWYPFRLSVGNVHKTEADALEYKKEWIKSMGKEQ